MPDRCNDQMFGESRVKLPLAFSRSEYLLKVAAAHRRVAHIGAADSPYTSERLADETLLHALLLRLDGVEVVGFDTDIEAAELLSRALNAPFETIDVTAEVPAEHIQSYDLVLAGEVLEHVDDANRFLLGCKTLLTDDGVLCVTVPNACSPKVGLRALMGTEVVHPDHHTYYSPRTLRKTLDQAGFRVFEMLTYLYISPRGRLSRGFSLVLRGAHALRQGPVGEGLIALAQVKR